MKFEHYLTSYTENNSKKIKDIKVRPESIELLKENIGNYIDLGDNFLILTQKQNQWKQK